MLKLLDTKTLVFELKLNNWAHHSNQLHYEAPISVAGYEYTNALEKVLQNSKMSIVLECWHILKLFISKLLNISWNCSVWIEIIQYGVMLLYCNLCEKDMPEFETF